MATTKCHDEEALDLRQKMLKSGLMPSGIARNQPGRRPKRLERRFFEAFNTFMSPERLSKLLEVTYNIATTGEGREASAARKLLLDKALPQKSLELHTHNLNQQVVIMPREEAAKLLETVKLDKSGL